jgi:hypothetical protein
MRAVETIVQTLVYRINDLGFDFLEHAPFYQNNHVEYEKAAGLLEAYDPMLHALVEGGGRYIPEPYEQNLHIVRGLAEMVSKNPGEESHDLPG